MFGKEFCLFFISVHHFWIKHYTNFPKFNEICITSPYCYSRPLSPPRISHRKLFFDTACFELFGGGHGHLATLIKNISDNMASLLS